MTGHCHSIIRTKDEPFSISMHFIKTQRNGHCNFRFSHFHFGGIKVRNIPHIHCHMDLWEETNIRKPFLHFNLNCIVVRNKVSSQLTSFIHSPSQFLLTFGALQVLILDSVQNIVQKQ